MRKKLVIEGCFDLFHKDHRAFISRSIELFQSTYGYIPDIHVQVMSNEWAHRKGPARPFMDIADRITALKEYLSHYPGTSVAEATRASFEFEDQSEFETMFENAVIAISKENVGKIKFPSSQYLIVQPINQVHTTDIERVLTDIRDTSRCAVRKVGAVFVRDGHIVRQASNTCCCLDDNACVPCKNFLAGEISLFRKEGCTGTHAEETVLSNIVPKTELADGTLLVTTAPCSNCAQRIIHTGIQRVVYLEDWKRLSEDRTNWYIDTSGIQLLQDNNVKIRKAGI